jgi:hypothetical protein
MLKQVVQKVTTVLHHVVVNTCSIYHKSLFYFLNAHHIEKCF